jgi:hypothetical protein
LGGPSGVLTKRKTTAACRRFGPDGSISPECQRPVPGIGQAVELAREKVTSSSRSHPTNTARGRLVTEEVASRAPGATGNDGTKGRVVRLSRRTMPRCMLCWLDLGSTLARRPVGRATAGCPPACLSSPGAMLTTASARIAPRAEHRRGELSVESDLLAPSACDLCDSPYLGSPGLKLSRGRRTLEGPRDPVLFARPRSRPERWAGSAADEGPKEVAQAFRGPARRAEQVIGRFVDALSRVDILISDAFGRN